MMLSDRLATDPTLGFKVARIFTISDRLMVVVHDISSYFGRKRSPNSFAVSGLHCPDRQVSPALRETRSPGPRAGSNGKFSAKELAAFRAVSMSQLVAVGFVSG